MSFREEIRVPRLVSLQGRRARLSYLLAPLVVVVVLVVIALAGRALHAIGAPIAAMTLFVGVFLIAVGASWVSLAVSVQRLHDLDLSGWWILVAVAIGLVQGVSETSGIPALMLLSGIAGLAFGVWLLVAKGTDGPNRFGPPPTWPA
jgi:uncharacterized membrane protein YhaH (DUF805 family)